MPPTEDASPGTRDRTRRPDGDPPGWFQVPLGGGSAALLSTGIIIVAVNSSSPTPSATSSWLKVGFLFSVLGLVAICVPTALVALRHPWATSTRRMLAETYKHPRLANLALIGACILILAWLSIPTLLQVPIPLWLILGGMGLAAAVPLLTVTLFDQHR